MYQSTYGNISGSNVLRFVISRLWLMPLPWTLVPTKGSAKFWS